MTQISPLRVLCENPYGERQSPAEGNPPAALVSPCLPPLPCLLYLSLLPHPLVGFHQANEILK
ncbi:hypothetical protein NIES2098_13300 [Calothrix sp. NIES-2098]|nr:hypothetical protein NIES2098_13300 [Calothrix sp. NIES-2098]